MIPALLPNNPKLAAKFNNDKIYTQKLMLKIKVWKVQD